MKRPTAFLILAVGQAYVMSACDDPGATLVITDTRTARDPANHVVVDVDIEAHEAVGKNIGTYCVRVTFTGEDAFQQDCRSDLQDGDTRTARFVSGTDLKAGAAINVRVRLGAVDDRRDFAAP